MEWHGCHAGQINNKIARKEWLQQRRLGAMAPANIVTGKMVGRTFGVQSLR
jgi:hypothetical protein